MDEKLSADELKRLREAAGVPELGASLANPIGIAEDDDTVSPLPKEKWFSVGCLSAYLVNHSAEIEEALRDRERMDWCESMAAAHPELEKDGLVPMTRAAIDAAMKERA